MIRLICLDWSDRLLTKLEPHGVNTTSRGKSTNMEILDRIDWASVNWLYVAVLAALVFFSTLIGALLSFKRAFRTAVLSALLFAAGFVFWTYYPHGLPLPTSLTAQKVPDTLRRLKHRTRCLN